MWIFYVADAALLGAAWFIATRSGQPLSWQATLAIVVCVVGGAVVALVPLVARFERQKNEMLDDRQRALEALARTVSASAEQISIAVSGLHQIAELAQKNLRHAEQLPHKLQEKIAEFQAQLANANDAEKEELERELVALRTSESERLDSISDKIAKSAAEWSKLEAATHQHLSAASEALARLSTGTAAAIGKAQAAAEQALGQARVEAARAAGEASGSATRAIDEAKAAALADIDAKFASAGAAVAENFVREVTVRIAAAAAVFDEKISRLESAGPKGSEDSAAPPAAAPPEALLQESAAHDQNAPLPSRRPRKARHDASEPPAAQPPAAVEPALAPEAPPAGVAPDAAIAAVEPPPIPSEKIIEVAPVVPDSESPFSPAGETITELAPLGSAAAVAGRTDVAPAIPEPPAPRRTDPPRRRAPRKPVPDTGASPGLPLDEPAPAPESADLDVANPALVERILTSDGATRLLVTAYIGIGNRLFIRGDGPGLSWEKGVPLQFVSIGKWRWETNDAAGPIKFKLFKNDEIECAALGAQSLDPGHQQEVTAGF